MGKLLGIVTPLHRHTTRSYLPRMLDDKVTCMKKAKAYGADYWDGDRRFGYGGYRYDGRWKVVAERLIEHYALPPDARILDIGCGKAHLLHEMQQLLPNAVCTGFDVSVYALTHAPDSVRDRLFEYRAEEPLPFGDASFDLVFSLGCLHNLRLFQLHRALTEVERVGRAKYVMVESYRNEQELFNLQCWALTAETFLDTAEWIWLFRQFGYSGDYEFIYFE